MATPTLDEIQAQIGNAIKNWETLRANLATNAANFDTAIESLKGDFSTAAAPLIRAQRARAGDAINADALREVLTPMLLEHGKFIGAPEAGGELLFRIKEYMATLGTPETINAREFTNGAAVLGGSNVGDGTIHRQLVDRWGYPLEARHAEVKTFEIVEDQTTGVKPGREVFLCRGEEKQAYVDVYAGSGISTTEGLTCRNGRDSILKNSSFDSTFGAESATKIPNWTISGTSTNITAGTKGTDYYRAIPNTTTANSNSIVFSTNEIITQKLTVSGRNLDRSVPYNVHLAYKKSVSGATGNIKVRLGATETVTAIATPANTTWNSLMMTADKGLWLDEFNEDDLAIDIEVDSLSSGTIHMDDIIFAPYTLIDGGYYWPVGGATHFLIKDTVAFTDSISSDSILAQWFWRCGLGSWPSATGAAETWADP